jgi:macrodomain Ter protein organizer (MatP/YcbG family)
MSEAHTKPVALTPSTYDRLVRYAKKHEWTLSAAACYLIEDGMDGEERRTKLAREARERPDSEKRAKQFLDAL